VPDFVVSTTFRAKDQVTASFKRMGRGAAFFEQKASQAFRRASANAANFGTVVKGILGARVIGAGVMAMRAGVGTVAREFVGLDQAISSAAAKFPETIKRGSDAFKELETVARKVGAQTKFSAMDAAGGLEFLAMAGFNAKASMAALPLVTDLTVIAQTDLARATDIATDSLGAFGLMERDAAKLTTNLTRVNDVFAKTITTANTDIEQLFESVKFAGPVATAAGASIETFSALTGQLANAGIKGSIAGTTLKNMFLNLAGATPQIKRQLKSLGVSIDDGTGNMRDMIDILGDLQKATENMGTRQKSAALDILFGKRAVAGANVLLSVGADKLRDYRKELQGAAGSAKEMAGDIQKSLENRLLSLKNALVEIGFKLVDAFMGKGPESLDAFIEAVRTFDVKPVIAQIKEIISMFKTAISVVDALSPIIAGAVAAWAAYKTVIIALAIKQAALNIVLLANPIGLVIAALGALVAAGVYVVKHWSEFRDFFTELWADLTSGFENWGENISLFLKDLWKRFKESFAAIWESVKPYVSWMGDLWKSPIELEAERRTAKQPPRIAPNRAEAEARRQIDFQGKLSIAGAPKGSTFESKTRGAPPVKIEMAGANI
jgi:TP901 family phage tail tape measure protein